MLEPFQLPFVQRGLVEVLLLAVAAGLLGTWIVLRGLAFFSHAVGTAAFPGLVLADGLGFAAPLGAFGAAVVFAAGIARARPRAATSGHDSVIALVLVGCLAAGVILASDVFHSGANVETLLFGSLLLIDGGDIALAARRRAWRRWSATRAARAALARRAASTPARRGRAWAPARCSTRAARAGRARHAPRRSPPSARCWSPRCSSCRRRTARLFTRRLRGLAARHRRPRRRRGHAPGSGSRSRPTRRPGRRSPASPARVFALVAAAGRCRARAARAPRRGRARRRCAAASCSAPAAASDAAPATAGSTSSRRRPRSATGCARSAATRVAVDQILAAEHRPARVRAAPQRRRGALPARRSSSPTATTSTPGSTRSSQTAAATPRSSTSAPTCPERLPGESSGAEASALRPALVARPAQRRGRRAARSATRWSPPTRPTRRALSPRNAAAYLRRLRALDAGIARCLDSVPAGAAQARHRPRRLRLLRPPLRDRRRRRRDPVADDPGPALGRRRSPS